MKNNDPPLMIAIAVCIALGCLAAVVQGDEPPKPVPDPNAGELAEVDEFGRLFPRPWDREDEDDKPKPDVVVPDDSDGSFELFRRAINAQQEKQQAQYGRLLDEIRKLRERDVEPAVDNTESIEGVLDRWRKDRDQKDQEQDKNTDRKIDEQTEQLESKIESIEHTIERWTPGADLLDGFVSRLWGLSWRVILLLGVAVIVVEICKAFVSYLIRSVGDLFATVGSSIRNALKSFLGGGSDEK